MTDDHPPTLPPPVTTNKNDGLPPSEALEDGSGEPEMEGSEETEDEESFAGEAVARITGDAVEIEEGGKPDIDDLERDANKESCADVPLSLLVATADAGETADVTAAAEAANRDECWNLDPKLLKSIVAEVFEYFNKDTKNLQYRALKHVGELFGVSYCTMRKLLIRAQEKIWEDRNVTFLDLLPNMKEQVGRKRKLKSIERWQGSWHSPKKIGRQ